MSTIIPGKSSIVPGKGFQYTPQNNIKWADDFNNLMSQYNSRNELVSKLIEDGLKVQSGMVHEGRGVFVPLDNFTDEQLTLIRTKEGMQILENLLKVMLGQGGTLPIFQSISSNTNTNFEQSKVTINESAATIEPPKQEKKRSAMDRFDNLAGRMNLN